MESTFSQYRKIYEMLEDEKSRDIYLQRLNYLLSGDCNYIRNIVTSYLPQFTPLDGRTMQDLQDLLPKGREIVLYGAGFYGKHILSFWEKDERFVGFCCQTKKKQEEGYLGYPVMSPEKLLHRRDLTVIISTIRAKDEIMQILREGNYPEDQVFPLSGYQPEYDPGQYFSPDFIKYEEEEVFVDGGCLDLGSSLQMKKYCKNVKKVYAFEPDPENYQNCLKAKERTNFDAAEVFPFGLGSRRETITFQATHDGSSLVCEHGNMTISVVPMDEVIPPEERITMIKLDVEGSELEALKGAQKIIRRDKPKLAICIYHKHEDMTEIPLYIKQLVPEYKLYIRHHSNTEGETVLYAVMPH